METVKANLEKKLNKEIASLIKRSRADAATRAGASMRNPFINVEKEYSYQNFLSNKMLIMASIRTGIPYSLFELIRNDAPFTENDWANLLDLSTKSLQRYKQTSKNFRPLQSEKIIEMAEVTHVGINVFGDMEKLKLWLNTPNFSLGNLKPIEMVRDSYGKEMVIGELTRINHGILV